MKKDQRGFVRFILLIIIILVIAQFLGYSPVEFINEIVVPVFAFVWKIILIVVDLLVEALRQAYKTITEVANKISK